MTFSKLVLWTSNHVTLNFVLKNGHFLLAFLIENLYLLCAHPHFPFSFSPFLMDPTPTDNFLDDIEALAPMLVSFHQNNIEESLGSLSEPISDMIGDTVPDKVLWQLDTTIVLPDKREARLLMCKPSLEEPLEIVHLDYLTSIGEDSTASELDDTMYDTQTKIVVAIPGATLPGLQSLTRLNPQWDAGAVADSIPTIVGHAQNTCLEDIRTFL